MAEAKGPLGKWVAIPIIAWLLTGLLPLLAQIFGAGFLPSTEWAARTSTLGLIAWLGTTVLLLWIVRRAESSVSDSTLNKFGAVLGAMFLGFLIGRATVDIAGPMAMALVAGDETELQFTVVSTSRRGFKGCRSSVELEGLPIIFDSTCGVADAFRDSLTPGTRVILTGRRTGLGIFARHIRRAD